MATSVLDKTMRKIEKAFESYQVIIENMDETDLTVAEDYDPEKEFVEKVREIVSQSLLDGAEMALRRTITDIRESLAEIKDLRERE